MNVDGEQIQHVYVHAPFCTRRCVYCDFAVEVSSNPDGFGWLKAIEGEVGLLSSLGIVASSPPRTLYVGGGTPSLLPSELFTRLGQVFGVRGSGETEELEWTAEANPESFTKAVAEDWVEAGVNRVSLGVQTFSTVALKWMGRLHSPHQAVVAIETAQGMGITNLSVDLIFGLPDSVSRSWREDLNRILDLGIPHVSLYGLGVETGTPLHRQIAEGRVAAPREARYREEFLTAREVMVGAGYRHYEVSNFALPGAESRHNGAYWTDAAYLGLGNGAHSFHRGRRWWNHRSWTRYASEVERGRLPRAGDETLTPEQVRLETLWLALRRVEGWSIPRDEPGALEVARNWEARGLAECGPSAVRLTGEGWLLLDGMVLELDQALAPIVREGVDA